MLDLILVPLLSAVISYFLGCSNGAVLISKYLLHNDVRDLGSGNAGLTNFYRTLGGPLTIAVILIDTLKAVAAVALTAWFSRNLSGGAWASAGDLLAKYWALLFCLLGHMFPCMFHFKGGKGVLSGVAVIFMIDWRIGVTALVLFLICVLASRYVSLGSIVGAAAFIVGTCILFQDPALICLGALCGGLVIWQHRGNIQRLIRGEEKKFSFRQ